MEPIKLEIRKYSGTPGPRYRHEGNWSGEDFRETTLLPAIKQALDSSRKLLINLDGTAGYGTSFLEESFGGLIRIDGISYEDLKNTLEYISEEEDYLIEDINHYLLDAAGQPAEA